MSTLTVALDLPRDLLGALDVPRVQLESRLRELIGEGRISSGKGAELLGVSKLEFVRLLAQHGISYFTESSEELTAEVAMLDQLLGESNA